MLEVVQQFAAGLPLWLPLLLLAGGAAGYAVAAGWLGLTCIRIEPTPAPEPAPQPTPEPLPPAPIPDFDPKPEPEPFHPIPDPEPEPMPDPNPEQELLDAYLLLQEAAKDAESERFIAAVRAVGETLLVRNSKDGEKPATV